MSLDLVAVNRFVFCEQVHLPFEPMKLLASTKLSSEFWNEVLEVTKEKHLYVFPGENHLPDW